MFTQYHWQPSPSVICPKVEAQKRLTTCTQPLPISCFEESSKNVAQFRARIPGRPSRSNLSSRFFLKIKTA
eukprot:CAMPEP_0115691810 /NCGR_PEP_ID=MMETSP0272-20121206/62855_1 /TAXON_ID=71861 /ORGANISM="Scrippsiella trochoidea, Strain CCMP3099" /LENGTH=70 /DNA_ID=CAMNT_0003131815 /DNA_START=9 /DNA_END=217 /DNA_ORIENTATION=-